MAMPPSPPRRDAISLAPSLLRMKNHGEKQEGEDQGEERTRDGPSRLQMYFHGIARLEVQGTILARFKTSSFVGAEHLAFACRTGRSGAHHHHFGGESTFSTMTCSSICYFSSSAFVTGYRIVSMDAGFPSSTETSAPCSSRESQFS